MHAGPKASDVPVITPDQLAEAGINIFKQMRHFFNHSGLFF
jgi:hypothetical protein